jgi:signal peptidase I
MANQHITGNFGVGDYVVQTVVESLESMGFFYAYHSRDGDTMSIGTKRGGDEIVFTYDTTLPVNRIVKHIAEELDVQRMLGIS